MRKMTTLPEGLRVISNLYRDHVMFGGALIAALFAGGYFFG